jgi:3-hydroxyisobutyryl-CoA hydrolase
MDRI